jgi:type II secretory pathway pseudopilin PulG
MANIDKKEENRQLKKQLKQALRKIEKLQAENDSLKTSNKVLSTESKKKQRKLILSSLTEKEREITELLFPDTDTEK